jgi:hypothetical protein
MTDWVSSHVSTLRMRIEVVFETLVFSPFNHLTCLIAQENFIMQCSLFLFSWNTVTENSIHILMSYKDVLFYTPLFS